MTTAQLLIVCFTALLLAAIGAATLILLRLCTQAEEDELAAPPRIGHRVTVHTKQPDDQTLFGVLASEYGDRIVLEDAEYVTPAGGQPIPGQPHIATREIAWIDVHALVAPVPESARALTEG